MKSLNTFKTFKRDASVDGGDGSIPMDDLNGRFIKETFKTFLIIMWMGNAICQLRYSFSSSLVLILSFL